MHRSRLSKSGFSLLETLLSLALATLCLSTMGYFWLQYHHAQTQLLQFDNELTKAQNALDTAQANKVGQALQKFTYKLNNTQKIEVIY